MSDLPAPIADAQLAALCDKLHDALHGDVPDRERDRPAAERWHNLLDDARTAAERAGFPRDREAWSTKVAALYKANPDLTPTALVNLAATGLRPDDLPSESGNPAAAAIMLVTARRGHDEVEVERVLAEVAPTHDAAVAVLAEVLVLFEALAQSVKRYMGADPHEAVQRIGVDVQRAGARRFTRHDDEE